eukprot:4994163-Prymnesium_polylepis.1
MEQPVSATMARGQVVRHSKCPRIGQLARAPVHFLHHFAVLLRHLVALVVPGKERVHHEHLDARKRREQVLSQPPEHCPHLGDAN